MKIPGIERLRGVAILMVYLIHVHIHTDAFGYFRPLKYFATWAGVDLFFVISGFVVTLSLERMIPERPRASFSGPVSDADRGALRSFYFRRFFRLAPIGSLALFLHFVGATFGPRIAEASPFLGLDQWAREVLAVVSGLYNFVSPYMGTLGMGFMWSLSVEEQFYLLLPTLFLLAPTRRARTFAALLVLGLVAAVIRPLFSPNNFTLAHYGSHFRFDALAAGVVLALQRERLEALRQHVAPWARKGIVLLALGVILYVSRHTPIFFAVHNGFTLIWMASACLVAVAAIDSRDVLDLPLVGRTLEYVGSRSYALYVIHTFFLFAEQTLVLGASGRMKTLLTSTPGETVRFIVTFALALVATELAHRYIEVPCICFGKRYALPERHAPVVPELAA